MIGVLFACIVACCGILLSAFVVRYASAEEAWQKFEETLPQIQFVYDRMATDIPTTVNRAYSVWSDAFAEAWRDFDSQA